MKKNIKLWCFFCIQQCDSRPEKVTLAGIKTGLFKPLQKSFVLTFWYMIFLTQHRSRGKSYLRLLQLIIFITVFWIKFSSTNYTFTYVYIVVSCNGKTLLNTRKRVARPFSSTTCNTSYINTCCCVERRAWENEFCKHKSYWCHKRRTFGALIASGLS